MIDTVILSLPRNKAKFVDMTTMGVPLWDLQSRTSVYEKYVRNPSKRDKDSGQYFPRLTGFKRKNGALEWEANIRIEFSVPKLIFANNLNELSNDQFPQVIDALQDRLQKLGIIIASADLEKAEIRTVHYSKNVLLKHGYTAQYVINELGKINLNKRFDLTKAKYTNDGQSLYAYAQSHSFVIYDKVADLDRSPKRAIDKDQPLDQLALFPILKQESLPCEIIRFEVRLCKKQKINSLFKYLGFVENPTFKQVFDCKISERIVKHYWDTLLGKNRLLLFSHSMSEKDLLKKVIVCDPTIGAKEAIYRVGLIILARTDNGIRELRNLLSGSKDSRSWYRITKTLREMERKMTVLTLREWCTQIEQELNSYKPLNINSLTVNKSKLS